jgi:hypothetical protein
VIASWLERSVAPLDLARRATLGLVLRHRALGDLLSRRDRRLALVLIAHASIAFVLAVYAPLLLLVLGPVALGVVHVAADVRHLVLRRRLPAWWKGAVAAACVFLVALRVVDVDGTRIALLETTVVLAWLALAVLSGSAIARSRGRVVAGLLVVAALAVVAIGWPHATRLAFVHVHNVVALVAWLVVFRRSPSRGAIVLPLCLIAIGAALLLVGAMVPVTWHAGNRELFGMHLLQAVDWIAPVQSTDAGIALVTCFAFLQSVHYLVWLVVIPQDDVRGEGTLTFRMSARALVRDFGTWGLLAVIVATITVLGAAFVDVLRTRAVYLSLAMFHGYMELALLAFFWARGRAR